MANLNRKRKRQQRYRRFMSGHYDRTAEINPLTHHSDGRRKSWAFESGKLDDVMKDGTIIEHKLTSDLFFGGGR